MPTKTKIKILLADDHQVVRMGLAAIIAAESDLQLVGEANDGNEAVKFARELNPDVILMDLMMPQMDGQEAARAIRESSTEDAREIPIIALTADAFDDLEQKCFEAGMDGYLKKPIDTDELFRVLAREFDKR